MSDESLFREVDEEVRQDQFKKLWDRYGNAVIALCAVVVAGVAGFKGWQYWQVKQSEAAAESFFEAAALAGSKADDAAKQFAGVSHSGYGQLAKLRQANLLANEGKTAEAVKIYDAVAADRSVDATLRDLAAIRAGYALASSAKPDELEARVSRFDSAGNPWRHAAREILVTAALGAKDYAAADRLVNKLVSDPEAPSGMRQRMETISQLLVPLLAKK